jgi:hypothetical protein
MFHLKKWKEKEQKAVCINFIVYIYVDFFVKKLSIAPTTEIIYEGERESDKQKVIIRSLLQSEENEDPDIKEEVLTRQKLKSPYLVKCLDLFKFESTWYVVMEYFKESLKEIIGNIKSSGNIEKFVCSFYLNYKWFRDFLTYLDS